MAVWGSSHEFSRSWTNSWIQYEITLKTPGRDIVLSKNCLAMWLASDVGYMRRKVANKQCARKSLTTLPHVTTKPFFPQNSLCHLTKLFWYSLLHVPLWGKRPLKVFFKFDKSPFEPGVAPVNFIQPGDLWNRRALVEAVTFITEGDTLLDLGSQEFRHQCTSNVSLKSCWYSASCSLTNQPRSSFLKET